MSIDVGDIFAKSTRTLRGVELYFYNNFSSRDMKAACKAK
jgi:hypothetical protein